MSLENSQTATPRLHATPLDEQQHIVLHDVSWEFYERLLKELENRPIQVTFDNGSLEIMAPLHIHEVWKKRIAGLSR